MTRKQLEDLGISKEQADSIMKMNGDDIENAKAASAAEAKSMQTENSNLKKQVADRDKQLETLKASAGDNETLKKQIADLQDENAKTRKSHESEMNQLKVDFAVEKALAGAKAKNIKAVKALLEADRQPLKAYSQGTRQQCLIPNRQGMRCALQKPEKRAIRWKPSKSNGRRLRMAGLY